MYKREKSDNCFREFDDISPRKKEPAIQVLYEYEKHYLDLLRKYSSEIQFIENMLKEFREEQTKFYEKTLPQITKKLNEDSGIDNEIKKVWIKRLSENVDRSFNMSETLINDYTTKKIDEFKTAVNEKLKSL